MVDTGTGDKEGTLQILTFQGAQNMAQAAIVVSVITLFGKHRRGHAVDQNIEIIWQVLQGFGIGHVGLNQGDPLSQRFI